jgi:hypothetical protein
LLKDTSGVEIDMGERRLGSATSFKALDWPEK